MTIRKINIDLDRPNKEHMKSILNIYSTPEDRELSTVEAYTFIRDRIEEDNAPHIFAWFATHYTTFVDVWLA